MYGYDNYKSRVLNKMNTNALTTRERVQTIYKFNIHIITGEGGGRRGKRNVLKNSLYVWNLGHLNS